MEELGAGEEQHISSKGLKSQPTDGRQEDWLQEIRYLRSGISKSWWFITGLGKGVGEKDDSENW